MFLWRASHFHVVADMQFWLRFVGRAVEHVEEHVNDAQVVINCSVSRMELVFVVGSWNHWSSDEMNLYYPINLSMRVMYTMALGYGISTMKDKIRRSVGVNMISTTLC
jgi:hypothetical protein